ncbi:MAG: crossover junction endodeoxyribonuclease RuvC [Planctomycetota bacterium]
MQRRQNLVDGRVLGIDPGTLRVGFAIVDRAGNSFTAVEYGVIRASGPLPGRLKVIFEQLTVLAEKYRPTLLALEDVFFGKDIRAMEKIGEGRAIAKLVAAQHGMELAEYPPATVKLAVAGNGAASKEAVARMVTAAFRLAEPPRPSDASDALALALCHCTRGPAPAAAARPRSRRKGWTLQDVQVLAAGRSSRS